MPAVNVTLLSKPGCHLCDVARVVVDEVVTELADDASAPSITVEESSILDDPQLLERFAEEIPVVLVNGAVHTIWRVDAARLRVAILEA